MKTEIKPLQVQRAVDNIKKKLINACEKKGLYENFGQREVRQLEDKYVNTSDYTDKMNQIRNIIKSLDNWAGNYSGK